MHIKYTNFSLEKRHWRVLDSVKHFDSFQKDVSLDSHFNPILPGGRRAHCARADFNQLQLLNSETNDHQIS